MSFTCPIARKVRILIGVAPLILLLDVWTKAVVIARFRLGESIPVIEGIFNLTYVRNTGAAFGMLADAHPEFRVPFFLAVPVIALGIVGFVFYRLPRDSKLLPLALALVTSGAIGNLIDRIRFGFVVDFLDFHWNYQAHFPAFNVADSAICVGVALMMIESFVHKPDGGSHAPDSA